MLLPHRQTFCRRWLTRRLTPTGPSHLLLFLDTSAINTKLRKAVNSAEGSLWYGGEMLGGYLPRVPPPRLIPWRVCPWVPIYLLILFRWKFHNTLTSNMHGGSFCEEKNYNVRDGVLILLHLLCFDQVLFYGAVQLFIWLSPLLWSQPYGW